MSTWIRKAARRITITTPAVVVVVRDISNHCSAAPVRMGLLCSEDNPTPESPLVPKGTNVYGQQGSPDRGQISFRENREGKANFPIISQADTKASRY